MSVFRQSKAQKRRVRANVSLAEIPISRRVSFLDLPNDKQKHFLGEKRYIYIYRSPEDALHCYLLEQPSDVSQVLAFGDFAAIYAVKRFLRAAAPFGRHQTSRNRKGSNATDSRGRRKSDAAGKLVDGKESHERARRSDERGRSKDRKQERGGEEGRNKETERSIFFLAFS